MIKFLYKSKLQFIQIVISCLLCFLILFGLWNNEHAFSLDMNLSSAFRYIRIALLKDVKDITVTIRGSYEIYDPESNDRLIKGRRLKKTVITAAKSGINFGRETFNIDRIRLLPSKDVTILVRNKKRSYRGAIDIIRTSDNKITVVNQLWLEDYIKGVLYHEVSHRWPMEALKVQAVAARTYAVYQMDANKRKLFDVTNDIYSQVYGGRTSEKFRTNIAVDRTKGEIMLFNKKILPAYFHATCGGRTENVQELWNHDDLKPLRGVRCRFCRRSPHYKWKKNIRLKDVQDKLNKKGHKIGLIKDIRIIERNKSGRVKNLEIVSRDGKSITIPGKDFRIIVGPNIIRSNDYRLYIKGYYMDVEGSGWGHGVGMCQWGAYGMSKMRYRYDEILRHYYPGMELVNYLK